MSTAVDCINEILQLDGTVTHRGDELKCMLRDPYDGGTHKAYLDADECASLGSAFAALAAELRTSEARPK